MSVAFESNNFDCMADIAKRTGSLYEAYRRNESRDPLHHRNLFLKTHVSIAIFLQVISDEEESKPPYHQAWMDHTFLVPGDYLVGKHGIFFIAKIDSINSNLVVKTNTTITLSDGDGVLFRDIPASVLLDEVSASERLKNTTPLTFTARFPDIKGSGPLIGDVITTKEGDQYLIKRAELAGIVWKLSLRLYNQSRL